MPSVIQIATFAGLASLTVATPITKPQKREHSFRLNQVKGNTNAFKVGPVALAQTYEKYGKPVPDTVKAAAAAAVSGSATAAPEQYDQSYLVEVDVGGTTMNLDFDTGSADLWVFSSELPSSKSSGRPLYKVNPSKKMSGASWKISYGDGSGASGDVYADTVVVGSVTATSQAVEAATSVSSAFVSDSQNDGLVGLAFSSINTVKPKAVPTFFDNVKANLDSPLFAANLKAGQPGSYDFGFIDKSAYTGELDYTPVDSSQGFWSFTADGYSVGGGASSGSSLTGIADTGTTLLLTDDDVLSAYYAKVKGSENSSSEGGYVFPCDSTLPDFALIINGNAHTVPGSYINYAPTDNSNTTCFGGLQSDSGVGFSIFGDIFLKSQYVVFDSEGPRLGFGQQSGLGGGSSGSNSSSGTPANSSVAHGRSLPPTKMASLHIDY